MIKTVYEVVKEHKDRQENPKYSWIRVLLYGRITRGFKDVRNLKEVCNEKTGRWLEFDSEYTHVKIQGRVIQYIELIQTDHH